VNDEVRESGLEWRDGRLRKIITYICQGCGGKFKVWSGVCEVCGEGNPIVEQVEDKDEVLEVESQMRLRTETEMKVMKERSWMGDIFVVLAGVVIWDAGRRGR